MTGVAALRARLRTRPLDLATDTELLHSWVTHERSRFWGMLDADVDDVRQAYADLLASPHHDARIGLLDDTPVFLAETYDPRHHELADHVAVDEGDVGMHFLVAPPAPGAPPVHGLTRAVIETVVAEVLADPAVRRVVVEPDARNTAVHALNAAVGFEVHREVPLSDKRALVSTCTRAAFLERTSQP